MEEMEQQEEVRVAWGTGIAGHVAESGEPVNIPDAYQDGRFNCEIDTKTGYHTKALLCMPIKDSSGDVIGVAQVINKLDGGRFTEIDEKVGVLICLRVLIAFLRRMEERVVHVDPKHFALSNVT